MTLYVYYIRDGAGELQRVESVDGVSWEPDPDRPGENPDRLTVASVNRLAELNVARGALWGSFYPTGGALDTRQSERAARRAAAVDREGWRARV